MTKENVLGKGKGRRRGRRNRGKSEGVHREEE